MEPGETWAYREKAGAPLTPVVIEQLGTRRPSRVRVRFVEDSFEGREEWVPPGRLKVEWDKAEQWLEHERRWHTVHEHSPHHDDPELGACGIVLDAIATDPSESLYNDMDQGVLVVRDVDSLVAACGTTPAALMADPASFQNDDGTVVVPWSTTREIAQLLAQRHADQVVDAVVRQETRDRRQAIYGDQYGRRDDQYISPETCAKIAADSKRAYDIVRQWCGTAATGRHDELVALRDEVRRLGSLVERAVTSLAGAGQKKEAAAIERELGVPVELAKQAAASAHQDRRRR